MKLVTLFRTLLPLLLITVLLSGNAQAALLDFGPIVPEVVGSTPPNIRAGFPLWFRDTNRVPLQLCLEEVPGCLFAAVDRPDLAKPLAFPNIPDELFYYSATALIGNQLLFAGVEMNFFDNGDGTYEQVGFSRVRIRIDSTIAGNYIVTTPWKQYFFTVDQATIAATGGLRVINATEDIGLGPDGVFAGVLGGSIGPYVYSQGAPFVTAAGSFLGDNTPRLLVGSTFTDPVTGQPANIFRIQGPPGFTTVSTDQFAITGKLYITEPTPTPLTVDKVTYALDNTGLQVNAFATTEVLSNQVNGALPFPANFALTGAPSVLQLTSAGVPTQAMTTNNPADGKFFSASGLFTAPLPDEVTVTNTADVPPTVKIVPLVDEVVIDKAVFNPLTGALSITASSLDRVVNPALQAFLPGVANPLGTLSNGQFSVTFPVTDNSGLQPKTYTIPASTITVKSAKGGSATVPVVTFIPAPPPPASGVTASATPAGTQTVNTPVVITANGAGGNGQYEYRFYVNDGTGFALVQPYSATNTLTWTPTATGNYDFFVEVRTAGTVVLRDAFTSIIGYVVSAPVVAAPVANNDGATVPVDGTVIINVVGNDVAGASSLDLTTVTISGPTGGTAVSNANGTVTYTAPSAPGTHTFTYTVKDSAVSPQTSNVATVTVTVTAANPATGVTAVATPNGTQTINTPVVITASGTGGSGQYEYRFYVNDNGTFYLIQPYSSSSTCTWLPGKAGSFDFFVEVRSAGTTVLRDAFTNVFAYVVTSPAATNVYLSASALSPQPANSPITFTAQGVGGVGANEYRFWLNSGSGFVVTQPYSTTNTWVWTPTTAGSYDMFVEVRKVGSTVTRDAFNEIVNYQIQ